MDFLQTKDLSSVNVISCDSVYLRYPYRVEIKNSLAVIIDRHPEICFLHAFIYPDWKYVISFDRRSEDTDEILSA
ncbi:BF3164 family lipoprotein [uncultured Bacteroides sp.]|nr:BF3164 family lipoprotein [uncultured Bacteroides sp.]